MGLTLGGLASGMDTGAIVDALVGVRRSPILRLEERKTDENNRLTALKDFDSKLDSLLTKVNSLDTAKDLIASKATPSSEDYLSATGHSSAVPGNYEIKVGQLAQVEKSVFEGVADKDTTTFGTGTLRLDHDGLDPADYPAGYVDITLDPTNNTLEGMRDAINADSSKHGVSASIVNDGSGTPYRLVLTGKSVTDANITLDSSGLSGGAALPTVDATVSRSAKQAIIQVDGITITSDTNTLTEAVPGVTLDLTSADLAFDPVTPNWDAVASTNLRVATDTEGIKEKVDNFVSAFNDLVKAAGDESLSNDSGVRAVVSALRSKFYDQGAATGLYQLGIKTQKDGTLEVDSEKLSDVIKNDLDTVQTLLAGDGATEGIGEGLKSALDSFTSPTTGLLAGRQKLIESGLRRIDKEIARKEEQLASYEERLIAQFSGMESMVSSLNSQGSYLAAQMASLSGGN